MVRRPSRHPWLATIALVAFVLAAGVLLRALDAAGRPTVEQRDAMQRPGAPVASGQDTRRVIAGSGR